jgi:flagellar P-ring protein precursor FlgI
MWFLLLMLIFSTPAQATRAKDVGAFHGVRDNQLQGAGLVVGLQRSGDSTRNVAAIRSLASRLQGMGQSLDLDELSSRNIALVMVTATLGPDARAGTRLDVTVASTGDAVSLEGGMLLWTPLFDQLGRIAAVAEGSLVVGGFTVGTSGNSARKNKPTVGRISAGALIQIEGPSGIEYATVQDIDYILNTPDFTTASRLAEAVNGDFGTDIASATSASTVHLVMPEEYHGKFPNFAARIESIELAVDAPATVVVNERTGTVVVGANVRVSAVAVAHGGLTIEVRRLNGASQPAPLSAGVTEVIQNTVIEANEQDGQLVMVEGVDIGALVSALNDMGVKPRDLIVILQAMHSAGALQAEIVTL